MKQETKQWLQIKNRRDGQILVERCALANTAYRRLVGLLNHASLDENEALLIEPCNQVHSFFMRFPIDVVFLSADNTVVSITPLKEWRLTKPRWKAKKVLELAHGTCAKKSLQVGDRLELATCSS